MARKGKANHLQAKIEQRRKQYGLTELKKVVKEFFTTVDEDSNGYLESHEFVTAQAVVAELAGDMFHDEKAAKAFDSIKPFDKDGNGRVDLKEFTAKMVELFEAMPENAKNIRALSACASSVNSVSRRELGREIRQYFVTLDTDGSKTLSTDELVELQNILEDLAKGGPNEGKDMKELCSLTFDKKKGFDINKDGQLDSMEFVNMLTDRLLKLKVPKKDLVLRLRELRQGPEYYIFKMHLGTGRDIEFLTVDNSGWATVSPDADKAIKFKQESAAPTMIFKVAEGTWKDYYLSSEKDKGVGLYKIESATSSSTWRWDGNDDRGWNLASQNAQTSGLPIAFRAADRMLYCSKDDTACQVCQSLVED